MCSGTVRHHALLGEGEVRLIHEDPADGSLLVAPSAQLLMFFFLSQSLGLGMCGRVDWRTCRLLGSMTGNQSSHTIEHILAPLSVCLVILPKGPQHALHGGMPW